jgi:hypothetical protein
MRTLRFALFVTMVAAGLALVTPAVGFCCGASPPPPPSGTAACYFFGFSCTSAGICTCGSSTLLTATVESVNARENETGTEDLDCTGDIPASAAPKQAVICQGPANGMCTLTGFPGQGGKGAVSGHHFVFTPDWQQVISPSGQVTLHCHNLQPLGS